MSKIHWKHGVSGDWSDARDWSGGKVPGATDNVLVAAAGSYTLTIDAAEAAESLVLDAAGATIADNAAFDLGTDLTISAGTFKIAHGGSVNGGTVSVSTGGHFVGRDGTVNSTLIDDGSLKAAGGTLTIDGLVTGDGYAIAGAGATLDFADGANFSGKVGGAGTLVIDGSGSSTLAGELTTAQVVLDAGGGLQLTGGGSVGGSISGAGGLSLEGSASYSLTTGATLAVGILGLDAELFTDGGTIDADIVGYGNINVTAGTLVLEGVINDYGTPNVAAGATLESQGGGTLGYGISGGGTLEVTGPAPLNVSGAVSVASINIMAGATFTNYESLTLTGAVTVNGTLASGCVTVDNLAGGTGVLEDYGQITVLNGAALTETITGRGTITLDQGTYTLGGGLIDVATVVVAAAGVVSGTGTLSSQLDIGGAVEATGGTLTFADQIDFGPSPGTLSASAGSVLDVSAGGSLYAGGGLYGAVTGAGTLELATNPSGTNEFDLDFGTLAIASVVVNARAMLTGGGDVLGTITNNGTILTESGTLTMQGAVLGYGEYLTTSGTVMDFLGGGSFGGELGGDGAIRFDSALTLNLGAQFSGGNIIETADVTLGSSGNLYSGYGTLFDIDAAAGATVALSGSYPSVFSNGATLVADGAGAADVSISFTNTGTVSVTSGTLAFLGSVANNGLMDISAGTLSIASSVGGSGTMQVGASTTLALEDGTGTGQTVDFLAATGLVDLAAPLGFDGVFAGFGGSDIIDLLKTAETSFTYDNGVLTVMNGAKTVASLQFSGSYTQSDFTLGSDGHGGTAITFT